MTRYRVALYARVSTSNGHQDPELQLRELREFVERRGWVIVKEYVDKGISGSKDSRPALNQLMSDAGRRRFDAVVVWRFDRFARSVSHLLRALENFVALGIDFVSLSENVDTSTPTGKMVLTVLGAVAELERSLIVERVKAGLRNARAKGKTLGRPRTQIDENKVLALRNSGASWRAIAKETGGWDRNSPQSRSAVFQNPLRDHSGKAVESSLCRSASPGEHDHAKFHLRPFAAFRSSGREQGSSSHSRSQAAAFFD